MSERLTPDEANAKRVQTRVELAIADLRHAAEFEKSDGPVQVRIRPDDLLAYFTVRAEDSLGWMLSDDVVFERDSTLEPNVFVVRTFPRRWQLSGPSGFCRVDFFEIVRYLREELVGR